MTQRILVIGGGFAGLWAAAGAARVLDAAGVEPGRIEVALLNPDATHAIRVRCYEAVLAPARVPLDAVLGPIGVRRIEGRATAIDTEAGLVRAGASAIPYDRLILAAGSQIWRPPVPGLAAHGFDVDTLDGAARLAEHMARLGAGPEAGARTAVVIGAGLVGIEIACESRERVAAAFGADPAAIRVILLDHAAEPGAGMGPAAL
ncbi:MAG: FAD-dependent oxidoreductase, partial [Acetobacteraceae bacterium]|nr:FAD-dependent oxidoreductase [Acetobacteraceae bacterium]